MNLRQVDPKTLVPNPANPRRTKPDAAYEDQLAANIREIGLIQPPIAREIDGRLVIKAGDRRTRACIAAGLATIPVLVIDGDDANHDSMRAFSENIVRAGLGTVDMWRAIEALCGDGWSEDGIATALSLPPRVIKRLKLCGSIHPAILDQMAKGDEPNERDLRTIASASREDQAEAWKKHKPKKTERTSWWELARALTKTRFYARDAEFDAKIAKANGILWEEDLFAQDGQDNRFTTQADAYLNAQHEYLSKKLPKGHVILPLNEQGEPKLPAKATRIYGDKPGKGEIAGRYVNERTGCVETVIYRLPAPKPVAKSKAKGKPTATAVAGAGGSTDEAGDAGDAGEIETAAEFVQTSSRPPVTKEGLKMIGDFQTDALHEALDKVEIDDQTLIALLVLAFAGDNVQVRTGEKIEPGQIYRRRSTIAYPLISGGVLTFDPDTIRTGARAMLKHALCMRDGFGMQSGPVARIAGNEIDADRFLPSMATQEFLSCLSKPEIERIGSASGVLPRPTGKATRAAVVDRFKTERFVYPAANFALSQEELTKLAETQARLAAANDDESDVAIDDEAPDGPTEADEDPEDEPASDEAPEAGSPSQSEQMAAE
ncbi:ParB N-terminal domain-containing protein [Acidiphilium acidophilum]|uniref:ParB N-terminal domain-containing protein n=1 Tax=Acidiphilium acidophilum TaxID=76588 RepID=A0AAW9DL49_ACIAO|nr:ParB N-terminal domain-containing protein [Acidiphilium acidophilum]MDX5929726.1 ParB N-terminal domain-containing protein [Acidiphilium acidophilum]